MPVKPTSAGRAPGRGRDGVGRDARRSRCRPMPRRRRSIPGARPRCRPRGARARSDVDEREERRQHLVGVGLAGHDATVDVDLAPVGHDVGGAAARDQGGVHGRGADERVLPVGQHLGQPQQEPRHRRDRVHASMRLRAVGRRAVGGGGEPGAAALGEADLQLARLADDRGVLGRAARAPTAPSCRAMPASSSSAARWNTSEPADRRAGPSRAPTPRRAPPRSGPSCRRRPGRRGGRRRRPRRPTGRAARCRASRRAPRRGGRSRRGSDPPRRRSRRRRSGGPRRSARSRARRRGRSGCRPRRRPPRPRCRPGSRSCAAISARANVEHLGGVDGAPRRRRATRLLYHGARCYTPTRSPRSPRRSSPSPRRRPAPATAWPPCSRRRARARARRCSSRCAPPRSRATPARSRSPAGCRTRARRLAETALREAARGDRARPVAAAPARRAARPCTPS